MSNNDNSTGGIRRDPNTCRDCGRDLAVRSHEPGCPQLVVRCEGCGERVPMGRAVQVDVSPPDEYYPEFIHLCEGCKPRDEEPGTDREDNTQ